MSKTLTAFQGKNPHDWYVHSILTFASAHAGTFGSLVQWGEVLTGLGLALTALLFATGPSGNFKSIIILVGIFSCLVAAFLSLNFLLAAGWMNPSTEGLNLLMLLIELILLVFWVRILKIA